MAHYDLVLKYTELNIISFHYTLATLDTIHHNVNLVVLTTYVAQHNAVVIFFTNLHPQFIL